MNPIQYIKNCIPNFLINLIGILALALFLFASGNSVDTVLLIVIVWVFVLAIYTVVGCYTRKKYLDGLLYMMESLQEQYLIAELMQEPERYDDQVFYRMLKLAERSMLKNVRISRQERREYRDYIEQWIHEVKTPITAMKLLCENNPSEFTRNMLIELEKIKYLTEQTLYYARSEHTEKDFYVREILLSDVVHSAIADNKYLLRQNGVTIDMEGVTDTVYTDDKWIRFILNQIIVNAVKYRTEKPKLRFYTDMQGDKIQFVVQDNGIGISQADLPRIFEKGFTGQNGRNVQNSTGIGLYLCKRLCDKLGIGITLQSDVNGTKVILTFYINDFILQG